MVVFHRGATSEQFVPYNIVSNASQFWEHLFTFAGDTARCPLGCYLLESQTDNIHARWAPAGPGNPAWQTPEYIFVGIHMQTSPITLPIGDPGMSYFLGADADENKLMEVGFQPSEIRGAFVPGVANSLPFLPSNVYSNSPYLRDVFYTQDNAGEFALYYVTYDSLTGQLVFKNMGKNVRYAI